MVKLLAPPIFKTSANVMACFSCEKAEKLIKKVMETNNILMFFIILLKQR